MRIVASNELDEPKPRKPDQIKRVLSEESNRGPHLSNRHEILHALLAFRRELTSGRFERSPMFWRHFTGAEFREIQEFKTTGTISHLLFLRTSFAMRIRFVYFQPTVGAIWCHKNVHSFLVELRMRSPEPRLLYLKGGQPIEFSRLPEITASAAPSEVDGRADSNREDDR